MSREIVRIANLSKSYGSNQVLSDVTFGINAGEILALMGENGAGKSTLLNVLSGATNPTKGRILIDGQEVRFNGPRDAFAAGIRVVRQEPDILPGLSVAENIFLGELPVKSGTRAVDYRTLFEQTARLMGIFRVGLDLAPDALAETLTPAQRQMIEILRTLRTNPRVLALDEPTSSLTELETEDLFRIVGELRASGIAIVYVSHRMCEIQRLADRVAVLRDGKLAGMLPISQASEAAIVKLMIGREINRALRPVSHMQDQLVLEMKDLSGPWLDSISLSVRKGEVVGLAGLVGAGRSEVGRTVFGTVPMAQGSIRLKNQNYMPKDPAHAIRSGIGYAPEERKTEALLMLLGIGENISLISLKKLTRFRFVNRTKEQELIRKYAAELRIKATSTDQYVSELSGGNQQKTVLARWLAINPDLLILDEPTRGIDVGAKAEIYRLIDDLASKGMAILLISSELPEILGLSDRIYVMQGGRITGELDRDEASEENILQLAMTDELEALPELEEAEQ